MQEFTNESGIYKCTCVSNGCSYIGQARFLLKRKQQHISELRHNKHYNTHFQRAWNKYGEENFTWEVLELCEEDKLNDREIHWIAQFDSYKNGFNQTIGGDGTRGHKRSEEWILAHSKITKDSWTDERRDEQRERMLGKNNPMYGKTGELNPAFGRNMSGENNPSYGKHHTEEAKEKNRQAHLGKNNVNSKPVICVETNELFWSSGEAGRNKQCDSASIGRVCKGIRLKTCGGYHWRYATQEEIELYNQINNIAS